MFSDTNAAHPPLNVPLKPPFQPGIPTAQSNPAPNQLTNSHPTGYSPSGGANMPSNTHDKYTSPFVPPPIIKPAGSNSHQNHSSLNSSRNSSPALSQSIVSNNPPQAQLRSNNLYQSNYNRQGNVAPPNSAVQGSPGFPPSQTNPQYQSAPFNQIRPNPPQFSQNSTPFHQPANFSSIPQTQSLNSNTQINSGPPVNIRPPLNPSIPVSQNSFAITNSTQTMPLQPPLTSQSNIYSNTQISSGTSLPFPNRQINPTLPPLVPNQGSAMPPINFNQKPLTNIGPPPSSNNNFQVPNRSHVDNSQYINNTIQSTTPSNRMPPNSSPASGPLASPYSLPTQMSTQPNKPSPQPVMPTGNHHQYPHGGQQNMAAPLYNNQQDLNHQMGRLNVTQGINKLWGNETIDLLQCRSILPENKLEVPTIKLNQHFSNSINCSPDIFRCTLTKIPETNTLLQKSRLPLGILIHPFKDLTHLPVIQCNAIVRCRSCRTYINPFVYFIDLKRWKCNLCYRVNDLPEEFQYDPMTKSYGDPMRRPEIQSATIEYIAPSEYMLRPPQPAVYLFLLDVSASAADCGYLKIFCDILTEHIDKLPGDTRTQVAFICYDSAIHFYFLGEGASRPKEMTVIDIDDIFLPSPEDLLVNLAERKTAILELLAALPGRHANAPPSATQSALGAALLAAQKLISPTGGRITVFQTCLVNVGPGALQAREDPNNRSSKEVAHLNPATDFYKRQALNCSGVHIAVDLFLLNSQYADLSTLSGVSRFSGGAVYHIPLFKASRDWQAQELKRCLTRYLTRKIGFEAVMRVRCTRGLAIHAFHGSFFVRSTDLLSLPNVSPDAGFGMQLAIEENLSDAQHVCFQAALLYTSSKGERRIRVHTLCLPVTATLSDVIHSADQQCIIGLLAKMAVDRSQTSSLSDAREALINAAVDALGTLKLVSGPSHGLICSMQLRLLPLYLLALLKCRAFRTGTSTRLDDRVASMCDMKSLPLSSLMRIVYPDLYPVHRLSEFTQPVANSGNEGEGEDVFLPNPPRLRLSAEKVNATGAYLLDQENLMVLYIGHTINPSWLQNALGFEQHSQIPDEMHSIPTLQTEENLLLHTFIDHLNDEKPYAASLHIIRDNSPSRMMFTDKLVDDRVEAALSYYEFLQHIKSQMK